MGKAAEKGLVDGTCASQGYTVKGSTQTKSYPIIGDIVITQYTKPAVEIADTCSLYEIQGDTCGQSDLDCQYVKYAKAAEKGLVRHMRQSRLHRQGINSNEELSYHRRYRDHSVHQACCED